MEKSKMEEDKNETLYTLYIAQMNSIEKKAFEIAKEHLGSSFNIDRSIGFIEWKKNHPL
jgi:hypothetical protein